MPYPYIIINHIYCQRRYSNSSNPVSYTHLRTFQKLDQAEIVLWMIASVNAASQIEQLSEKIIPRCEGKHLIAVFTKTDLIDEKQTEDLLTLLKDSSKEYTESIFISAKQRGNTEELQTMLITAAHLPLSLIHILFDRIGL